MEQVIGGVAYKLVGNRVRDKHGKFVTPAQLIAQQEEEAARIAALDPTGARTRDKALFGDRWKDLRPIWDVPTHPGWRMVRVVDPEDLTLFGKLQHHCTGSHTYWASKEQIWHFLTIMDDKNVPHTTLHLKDVEWCVIGNHPADKLATDSLGGNKLVDGYTMFSPFGSYGVTSYTYRDPVLVDGHRALVISVENYGRDYAKYQPILDAWYEASKEPNARSS